MCKDFEAQNTPALSDARQNARPHYFPCTNLAAPRRGTSHQCSISSAARRTQWGFFSQPWEQLFLTSVDWSGKQNSGLTRSSQCVLTCNTWRKSYDAARFFLLFWCIRFWLLSQWLFYSVSIFCYKDRLCLSLIKWTKKYLLVGFSLIIHYAKTAQFWCDYYWSEKTVPKSCRRSLLFLKLFPNDFNCDKACIPHRHNDSFLDSSKPCFIQIYFHPLWSSWNRQWVRHDLLEEDKCSVWQIYAPTHTPHSTLSLFPSPTRTSEHTDED